jgi:hypothetical protein
MQSSSLRVIHLYLAYEVESMEALDLDLQAFHLLVLRVTEHYS